MLQPYRVLASVPSAVPLMVGSLVANLYAPAVPLVLTFLVADWTGSYAVSGAVAAAMLVGQAVAGPLRGRMADRSSAPRLLLVTGGLFLAGMVVMTAVVSTGLLAPSAWWVLLPVSLLTGLSRPPAAQLARSVWPRITGEVGRNAAYSVEATAQELLFIVAPVLAAFAVGFWGSDVAALLCGVLALAGAAVFAAVLWRAGLGGVPAHTGSAAPSAPAVTGSLFSVAGFPRLLIFGGLLVGGLVTTDLVLIGWAREQGDPELAGVLAAVWALGSLGGGLVIGGFGGRPRLGRRACFASFGLVVLAPALPPLADPGSPLLVSAILLAGGAAIAPTLAAANSRMAEIAPHRQRSEAFGWFTSACQTGATAASPIAGAFLDTAGPGAAAAAAAVMVAVAAGVVTHHTVRLSPGPPAHEETLTA